MRILHLSTFDADTGAARGSLWLHHALRRRGVDSIMLAGRKKRTDNAVRPLPGMVAQLAARLRMRFDDLPLRRYRKTDESFWTIGWLPSHVESHSLTVEVIVLELQREKLSISPFLHSPG